MKIRSLGLFGNPRKEDLLPAIALIEKQSVASGVRVFLSRTMAATVGDAERGLADEALVRKADVIIALGGDGTMLRAARIIDRTGVPLLGINLGSLGYLTDVPVDELADALTRLFSNQYHLDTRSRVYSVVWRGDREIATVSALNDLVVNMGPLPRALDLEVRLDGDSLGRWLGDGVIFSTPTGSTAYNLSAGGPICHSAVTCLLLTPICPHSLGMRPLIIAKNISIELLLHELGEGATLTADGQRATTLENGDRLTVKVSEREVNLVKFPQSSFYQVMRRKLNWGAPQRQGNDH